jgi:hypothetical protein
MSNELEFARGVYAAVFVLLNTNYQIVVFKATENSIKKYFKEVMLQHGYHEIRINELYEQCKSK